MRPCPWLPLFDGVLPQSRRLAPGRVIKCCTDVGEFWNDRKLPEVPVLKQQDLLVQQTLGPVGLPALGPLVGLDSRAGDLRCLHFGPFLVPCSSTVSPFARGNASGKVIYLHGVIRPRTGPMRAEARS